MVLALQSAIRGHNGHGHPFNALNYVESNLNVFAIGLMGLAKRRGVTPNSTQIIYTEKMSRYIGYFKQPCLHIQKLRCI